ncbi:MAG: DUF1446 domain-containing protein [Gammaproteobacteria bacterium]|nr:DUF1446 domain-containing protein [Gammaproteobacteria bacterium]
MSNTVCIGSGAGFAGDRFDAAVPVVRTLSQHQGPRYLIYEVMGERTLAIAQRLKLDDPEQGYSPWLHNYLPQVLADCVANRITIVANFGNANPVAAAGQVHALARELGISTAEENSSDATLKVAVVLGDDLLETMSHDDLLRIPCIEGTSTADRQLIGANAYLGAQPVAQALALQPDIVLVGRSTDAALVLGPLIHEYGWRSDQYDLLAAGTLAGHLLECGAQVTGGYFADPGFKDVPDLDQVGFPLADIAPDGTFVLSKAAGTGGLVSRATVIEQMLYEVHDPAAYLTPDVTLDLTQVTLTEAGPDRVLVSGARGRQPPDSLKVTLSVEGGWLAEAEISYAGPNALARAELAADVVRKRLSTVGTNEPCRIEILGTGAVHASDSGQQQFESCSAAGEYRVRAAARCEHKTTAQRIVDEVLALYCCGPAAGGGVRQSISGQVSTASILLPRDVVENHVRSVLIPEPSGVQPTPESRSAQSNANEV